jgi:hypothetical protein
MAFTAQEFSRQSITLLADDITVFLAANPAILSVSVSNVSSGGAGFYCLLVYQT